MVKQKQEGDRKALRSEIRSVKHRVAISTDQKKIITLPIILPVKQTGLSSVCITTDKWTCEQHFVERFIYTIMKEQNKVFLVWSMEFSLFISLFLRFFLGRKRDSKRRRGREREGGITGSPSRRRNRAGTNTRSDPLYALSREQGVIGCKLKAKPGLYIVFYR